MQIKFLSICLFCSSAIAAQLCAGTLTDDQQAATDAAINDFTQTQKQLQSQGGISDKLFTPMMDSDTQMQTMDGSKSFQAPLLCQKRIPIVQTSLSPASNGEMNITISYDPQASGSLSGSLTIANVAAACTGGAVYDCQNGWDNCKFGVLEQSGGAWQINPNFPSGMPRTAEGMTGCFCFSSYCGGSSGNYIQQIQTFIAQPIADYITRNSTTMLASTVQVNSDQSVTWYTGSTQDCSLQSVSDLTAQNGKMDLNYGDTLTAAENDPESPWSLIANSASNSYSDSTCEINNKVSSAWGLVERTAPTNIWIGWDLDGDTKDCFYVNPNISCGTDFGETGSFSSCQALGTAPARMIAACNSYYVNSGNYQSITDVKNVQLGAQTDMMTLGVQCFGAGDTGGAWTHVDPAIALHIDCVGMKYTDRFICDSANKSQQGAVIENMPYSINQYDGCDEIRPSEDNCTTLEQNPNCKLTKEITDGAITVSNSTLTGATVPQTCKVIKGAASSITVCEPWWKKTRTYTCSDQTLDVAQAQQRVNYVGANLTISNDKFLSQMGDLVFSGSSDPVAATYMTGVQFQSAQNTCAPSCVVQQTVPNYAIVLPDKQAGTSANPGDPQTAAAPSLVPQGTQTIVDSFECTFDNNTYACPVPAGWTVRSQCSCGDGQDFAQAITDLSVVNQIAKDVVCSTGQDVGICDTPSSDVSYPVVCGNLPSLASGGSGSTNQSGSATDYSGTLVEGTDYWQCPPVYWTGKTPAPQTHIVHLDPKTQTCIGVASGPALSGAQATIATNQVHVLKDWFDPVIDWAKQQITEKLQGTDGYWLTSDGCDCGNLKDNEIPICSVSDTAGTTTDSQITCLKSGGQYETMDACQQACQGRATQFNGKTCIWQNAIQTGEFPVSYQLGNFPQQEQVFGAVFINAVSETTVTPVDCVDESEEVEVVQEKGTCDSRETNIQWEGPSIGIGVIQQDNYTNYRTQQCSVHPNDYNCNGINQTDCNTIINLSDWNTIKNLIKSPYSPEQCFGSSGVGVDQVGLYRNTQNYYNNNTRDVQLDVCTTGANTILNTFLDNSCQYALNSNIMNSVTGKSFSIYQTINPGNLYPYCGPLEDRYVRNFQSVCTGTSTEYICDKDNNSFKTLGECTSSCTPKAQYRCKTSGRIVDDPLQCSQFRCPTTNAAYTTNAECKAQCSMSSDTQPAETSKCIDKSETVKVENPAGNCSASQSQTYDQFVGPWVGLSNATYNPSGSAWISDTIYNIYPEDIHCESFSNQYGTTLDSSISPDSGNSGSGNENPIYPPNVCANQNLINIIGLNNLNSFLSQLGGYQITLSYLYGGSTTVNDVNVQSLNSCGPSSVNYRYQFYQGINPITVTPQLQGSYDFSPINNKIIQFLNDNYCSYLNETGLYGSVESGTPIVAGIAIFDPLLSQYPKCGFETQSGATRNISYYALTCKVSTSTYTCDSNNQTQLSDLT